MIYKKDSECKKGREGKMVRKEIYDSHVGTVSQHGAAPSGKSFLRRGTIARVHTDGTFDVSVSRPDGMLFQVQSTLVVPPQMGDECVLANVSDTTEDWVILANINPVVSPRQPVIEDEVRFTRQLRDADYKAIGKFDLYLDSDGNLHVSLLQGTDDFQGTIYVNGVNVNVSAPNGNVVIDSPTIQLGKDANDKVLTLNRFTKWWKTVTGAITSAGIPNGGGGTLMFTATLPDGSDLESSDNVSAV